MRSVIKCNVEWEYDQDSFICTDYIITRIVDKQDFIIYHINDISNKIVKGIFIGSLFECFNYIKNIKLKGNTNKINGITNSKENCNHTNTVSTLVYYHADDLNQIICNTCGKILNDS